jgi:hypothetical protein
VYAIENDSINTTSKDVYIYLVDGYVIRYKSQDGPIIDLEVIKKKYNNDDIKKAIQDYVFFELELMFFDFQVYQYKDMGDDYIYLGIGDWYLMKYIDGKLIYINEESDYYMKKI